MKPDTERRFFGNSHRQISLSPAILSELAQTGSHPGRYSPVRLVKALSKAGGLPARKNWRTALKALSLVNEPL